MECGRSDGFAKPRLITLIGGVVLLIVGLIVGYFFLSASQEREATAASNQFVSHINDQATQPGYDLLSDSLKSELKTIHSWTIWSREFRRGNITIEKEPHTAKQSGISLTSPTFIISYKTSNDLNLNVTAVKTGAGWRIDNYEIVD